MGGTPSPPSPPFVSPAQPLLPFSPREHAYTACLPPSAAPTSVLFGNERDDSPQDLPLWRPAEPHHLLPDFMGHQPAVFVGMRTPAGERCYLCREPRRWTQGLRWDNQAGLCLEAGLAWSSALSGRLSLAWYTSGQGLHVPAFLLFSITKQQEMGLRKGRHRKVSAALVLKHPQGREHLHSPRRMGHPSQVLGI